MTKDTIKTEDFRLVTVGTLKKTLDTVLKEERIITDDGFSRLEQKMTTFQKSLEMFAGAILDEIAAMREENREFKMQAAQLNRTYLIHEQKIDDLDNRVLKLETAK